MVDGAFRIVDNNLYVVQHFYNLGFVDDNIIVEVAHNLLFIDVVLDADIVNHGFDGRRVTLSHYNVEAFPHTFCDNLFRILAAVDFLVELDKINHAANIRVIELLDFLNIGVRER